MSAALVVVDGLAQSAHRQIDVTNHVDDVIAAFQREKIIPPGSRIVSRFQHVAAPGYPTPTLERDRALAVLHPALETLGIYSRGGFLGRGDTRSPIRITASCKARNWLLDWFAASRN